MKHIFAGLFFFILSNLNAQNRLYVNATASGVNNGQSWVNAFGDLQSALQIAQAGDEVWVAEGTYRPTLTNVRSISFEPRSGVRMYGGFVGNETNLSQRDWVAHATVLSGDIGLIGDSSDNSYNVVYLLAPDTSTILNGLTIRDGVADDQISNPFFRGKSGGGMYIMGENGDAYPEIRNCMFLNNTAANYGGGVMVYGGNNGSVAPRFVNCRFEANYAVGGYGGGMARIGGSWVERGDDLAGCVFYQNRSGYRGGGFYYRDNERKDVLEIHGCIFEENTALDDGGGAYMAVGRQNPSGYSIIGTSFIGNVADDGAAFVTFPQGFGYGSFFKMDSCVFEKNIHIFNNTSDPTIAKMDLLGTEDGIVQIRHCTFRDNSNCPEIFRSVISSVNVFFEDVLLEKNKNCSGLLTIGSAKNAYLTRVKFYQNIDFVSLWRIAVFTNVVLANCLVIQNNSISGHYYLEAGAQDSFLLKSCSFVDNNIGQPFFPGITNTNNVVKIATNCILKDIVNEYYFFYTENHGEFSYCSFDAVNCAGLGPYITCGPGNLIGLNPQFRDPTNQDYSLLPCSPLINAGNNLAAAGIPTDLARNPRIQDGFVDIGAYEAPAFALAVIPEVQPACEGDSNGSISVSPVFGCEPYNYTWSPAAGNGPQLNGLPPGNYLLTITDGSGRQILDTLQIVSVPVPQLNPVATNVQCGATLGGSISVGLSSGTAPFHYQWLPGAADTAYLSHLSPGDYGLTVVDANGCQDSASASIALMGMLTLMVDGQAISCYGQTDGWLSATPATGAAPFSWLWQGWQGADSVAQPLGPGSYAVTVSDAFGCTASFAFPTMTQPGLLSATVGISDQTDLNMPNGAAVVTTISGGTSPFGYEWNTGSTTQAIAGLTAGTYCVTVTDEHGCETVNKVIVQLMVGTSEADGQALMMYPNPAADWLKIVLPARHGLSGGQAGQDLSGGPSNATERRIEIADASGRVVLKARIPAGDNIYQMDLSGLPGGSYLVTVYEGSGGVFVGGVVKR